MNRKNTLLQFVGCILFFMPLVSLATVNAQKAKYKMTTEIPVSVTTPDKVKTSLGTLKFFDGFPDAALAREEAREGGRNIRRSRVERHGFAERGDRSVDVSLILEPAPDHELGVRRGHRVGAGPAHARRNRA